MCPSKILSQPRVSSRRSTWTRDPQRGRECPRLKRRLLSAAAALVASATLVTAHAESTEAEVWAAIRLVPKRADSFQVFNENQERYDLRLALRKTAEMMSEGKQKPTPFAPAAVDDFDKLAEWHAHAVEKAEGGEAMSMITAGRNLWLGLGVAKDRLAASQWFRRAVDRHAASDNPKLLDACCGVIVMMELHDWAPPEAADYAEAVFTSRVGTAELSPIVVPLVRSGGVATQTIRGDHGARALSRMRERVRRDGQIDGMRLLTVSTPLVPRGWESLHGDEQAAALRDLHEACAHDEVVEPSSDIEVRRTSLTFYKETVMLTEATENHGERRCYTFVSLGDTHRLIDGTARRLRELNRLGGLKISGHLTAATYLHFAGGAVQLPGCEPWFVVRHPGVEPWRWDCDEREVDRLGASFRPLNYLGRNDAAWAYTATLREGTRLVRSELRVTPDGEVHRRDREVLVSDAPLFRERFEGGVRRLL